MLPIATMPHLPGFAPEPTPPTPLLQRRWVRRLLVGVVALVLISALGAGVVVDHGVRTRLHTANADRKALSGQLDDANSQLDTVRSNLHDTKADLNRANASLANTQSKLDDSTIEVGTQAATLGYFEICLNGVLTSYADWLNGYYAAADTAMAGVDTACSRSQLPTP